jgi:hypothetical protein
MKGELHISAREATACTYLPDDTYRSDDDYAVLIGNGDRILTSKSRAFYYDEPAHDRGNAGSSFSCAPFFDIGRGIPMDKDPVTGYL